MKKIIYLFLDSYNVRVLLNELVNLRKNTPRLIFDVYTKHNKDIMKSLECVKINLDNNGEFNNCIVDPNYLLDNLNMKQVHYHVIFKC